MGASLHGSKEDRTLRERQALDLVAVLRSGAFYLGLARMGA